MSVAKLQAQGTLDRASHDQDTEYDLMGAVRDFHHEICLDTYAVYAPLSNLQQLP